MALARPSTGLSVELNGGGSSGSGFRDLDPLRDPITIGGELPKIRPGDPVPTEPVTRTTPTAAQPVEREIVPTAANTGIALGDEFIITERAGPGGLVPNGTTIAPEPGEPMPSAPEPGEPMPSAPRRPKPAPGDPVPTSDPAGCVDCGEPEPARLAPGGSSGGGGSTVAPVNGTGSVSAPDGGDSGTASSELGARLLAGLALIAAAWIFS